MEGLKNAWGWAKRNPKKAAGLALMVGLAAEAGLAAAGVPVPNALKAITTGLRFLIGAMGAGAPDAAG
jgi:hypothetical protein